MTAVQDACLAHAGTSAGTSQPTAAGDHHVLASHLPFRPPRPGHTAVAALTASEPRPPAAQGPAAAPMGRLPAATHEEQPRPPSCGINDLNFGWGAEGVVSPVGQGTEDDSNRAGSVIVRQAGPRSSTSRPTPQRPAERHRRDRPGQRPSAVGRGADSTRLGIVRLPTPQSTRRWSTIHHAACWRGTSAGGVSAGDPLGPGFRWRCGRRRPRRLRR